LGGLVSRLLVCAGLLAGAGIACSGGRVEPDRLSPGAVAGTRPGHRLGSTPCRKLEEVVDPGCEAVLYDSGGLIVQGFVLRPWPPEKGRRYPAIIFNRGGNEAFGRIDEADLRFLRGLAREGFVVLASQYRGGDGAPGLDEFGGADVEDVRSLFPLAHEIGGVDLDNVFMLGFSRGGMMTYLAIRDGAPIRAAAVVGGVSDLSALAAYRPEFLRIWGRLMPDFDAKSRALMRERSAVLWADRLDKPLLLLHGGADRRVPADQSRALAAALRRAGRPVELDVFPGDDHMLSAHTAARDARILDWFRGHSATDGRAIEAARPSAP